MERKQFTFYESFYKAMADMGMHKRGLAITLICDYALRGVEPPPQCGKMKMFMDLVYPNLAASRKKALAGQLGAGVTNRKRSGKIEKEIEKENEIETETETNCTKGEEALGAASVWVGFERFWNLYPVKIGQEEAWEQWQRICPDADAVCENLQKWKLTGQWVKEKGRYVPRAAKFLEQEYYLQTPEGAVPCGAVGQLGAAELESIERIMRED